MKRGILKKHSKQPISKIQRDIWPLCRELVERRDANKRGEVFCYTCLTGPLLGANKQLGHGPWPKSVLGAYLKYDLRVLHYQCMRCNQFMGGMGAEYYKRIKEELGEASMAQLEADRRVTVKAYDHYVKTQATYQELVDSGKKRILS